MAPPAYTTANAPLTTFEQVAKDNAEALRVDRNRTFGAAGAGALAVGAGSVGADMAAGRDPSMRRALLASILIGAPAGVAGRFLTHGVDFSPVKSNVSYLGNQAKHLGAGLSKQYASLLQSLRQRMGSGTNTTSFSH